MLPRHGGCLHSLPPYLQTLGFKVPATTSAGAAWRHAKADGKMSLDETLVHLREMVAATELPVNADFQAWVATTDVIEGKDAAILVHLAPSSRLAHTSPDVVPRYTPTGSATSALMHWRFTVR